MLDLLKVDFKRVLKDKLVLVVCIIAGVLFIINGILVLLGKR